MKMLLMSVALVAAVAAGYMMIGSNESELNMSDLASANVEALAGGMCPNGCLSTIGDGCFCHGWHEDYAEKVWPEI